MNDDALILQRCPACGHVPSSRGSRARRLSDRSKLFPPRGRGRVRTYTVIRRPHHERFAAHLPIVMALIELEDGVELISMIVGENRVATSIGARVAVTRHGRWSPLVQFSLERT